jgi:ribose/xylose/arabinose/galactoside ABC-type transport system permease subunit
MIIDHVKNFEQIALLGALIFLAIVLSILSPTFLTSINIMNLLRQASLVGITSLGLAIIILSGEIDLSVGSMQAAVGVLVVFLINRTGSLVLGIVAGLGLGLIVGIIIATIVTQGRVNSLIATLAMLAIIRGLTLIATEAASIQNYVKAFTYIGVGYMGSVPIPVVVFVILSIFVYYLLNKTIFGRNLYAVGGNSDAARLSGINVVKYKYIAFVIGGLFTSLAAIILSARLNSGQPQAGVGFELQVVSAVILGGVSLSGGRGTLSGVLIGVLILSMLSNGLVLLNVSSFWQEVARGIVLITAVFMDERRKQGFNRKLLSS